MLDHPLSRVMTIGDVARAFSSNTPSRSRGATRPSFAKIVRLKKMRAWGMPDARCTRGLVCKVLVASVIGLVCHRRRRM
jgi:hypothetical protein